ncbi:prolyl 4-hydroxylase 5 [Brassica rapa]|uniref:prolyl 4-hydroxylase 5 n=1 Tax=Brassica campestris TaxID=3711 RepID=UPI00142D2AD2|nr:prolyl 4-hydroxylase 5 [Brassica rapa]
MVRSIVSNATTGVQGVSRLYCCYSLHCLGLKLINAENGEGLRVIHYEVGQKFDPHFDGLGRIATFLMYLSDVDEGGETVFPMSSSGLSVSPKKGDAVLFWNNRPDGSQDPSSLHAGSPVIKGNKWAANKLFHFQEFKYPDPNTQQ